ncbi:hypothetical protein GWK47_008978 [Chionoecetes opilio]|uniref:HAT C-terminal dimerisation domain-containing protein n=1 Tax=Chionoecetes opilio TaxID=41210 RepID=A0A8J4Y5Q5_CHIOP|nr:hypothetical protein GWK47_008978 [Chionoecetes opilio]
MKITVLVIADVAKVDAVISRLLFEVTEQAVLITSEGSSPHEGEEDDFFKVRLIDFIETYCIFSLDEHRTHSYRGHQLYPPLQQDGVESWCSEKQMNKLLEQAMFPALSHAAWVDVFVNYNTVIPSSAAVERFYSQGSDIIKAKRASLTSDNFERLVGLHEGKHGPAQDGSITRRL